MAFQYGGDTFEGPYVAADGAPLQPAVFLSPYPHFMPFNGGAAPAKELSRTVRAKLYKTQLCRHVAAHGWCTHGDWCHFAHSSLELRPPPRPEAAYERAPDHGYDADAEGPWRDARFPPAVCGERLKVQDGRYKTMLCRHFGARGECPVGEMCHFAHGTEELRYSEGTNSARSPLRNGVLPRGFAVSPYVPFDVPCLLPRRPRAPQSGGVGGAALYKTQLCRYTAQQSTQLCPHAESCFYAHSAQELRQLPPRRQPHEAPAAAAGAARDAWAAAVAAASSDAGRLRALRDALTNAAGACGDACSERPPPRGATDVERSAEPADALTAVS
ncbi:hypothetical protein M885DRAFT_84060 [Pelagophyceae sp. CCMP2097]|nr:hypothetical protein M885DRAFT_84060 [Pelagophyceae sp. CCMP2097]